MANTKTYSIIINGVEQSIDAVKALNAQLEALESRIKSLEGKAVGIKTSGGGSKTSSTSSLSEEEKLERQIAQLDEKRVAYSQELYQNYLAAKDVLKETVNDQKQLAAAERIQADNYSNTMAGIKQKLADLKSVHFTTDISTDEFKNQTTEINALTEKLKQLEAEYGVYSRNVGNYANGVAEGLQKIGIEVGGTVREFDNAKQALKELKKERDSLAVKNDMGLLSEEEVERFKELIPIVSQLQSSIQDAGKPMDALMDTMQSFVALTQAGKGLAAFFGFDDDEIDKSIQKLVGLQNAMQGLQTIQKQLQSNEGIASWLTKGNDAIDKLVNSIFGVEKASKAATVASKALGTALKAIGIGALVAGITALITLLETWTDKQKKAAEEAEEAAEKTRKAIEEQRNSYVGASATYMNTASRLSYLRAEYMTTNNEMRKTSIIKEATEIFKKFGISVKSVTDAQDILVNQGDKVIEMIRLQGDAAALAALRMEAFKKSFNMLLENGYDVRSASILAGNSGVVTELDKQLDKVSQSLSKLQKDLGVNVKNGSDSIKKTVVDAEALIAKARVDAMKQGFVKTLAQLKLERDRRIAEAKKTGILIQEQIELINKQYQDKVFEARVQYHANLINEEKKYANEVAKLNEEIYKKEVENSRKRNELAKNEKMDNAVDSFNNFQVNALTLDYNSSDVRKYIDKFGKDVITAYINTRNTVEYLQNSLKKVGDSYEKLPSEAQKLFDKYSKMLDEAKEQLKLIEDENEGIGEVVKSIGILSEKTSEAYALRTQLRKDYYNSLLKASQEAADKELEIDKKRLNKELEIEQDAEKERHKIAVSSIYDKETDKSNIGGRPRYLLEGYKTVKNNGMLDNMSEQEAAKYFEPSRKAMDEWLNSLDEKLEEGEISWEEYIQITGATALKGYQEAKTNYEEFLDIYNSLSDEEKAVNEKRLQELVTILNEEYVKYLEKVRTEQEAHDKQMKLFKEKYENEAKESERNHLKQRQSAYTEFYSNLIKETEDVLLTVSNKIDKAEKKNAWGIINFKATKDELKDLQGTISIALNDIKAQKEQLLEKLKKGDISFGDYDTLISQLKVIETQSQDTLDDLDKKIDDLPKDWWETINQWIQVVGQTVNQVLGSLAEIQSNQYDKMIEEQEKYIDELKEMYDKQRDITQSYADAVNGIEDELSTARGDRRQQLIDQLNAEMAAQRASLAQQQKIEKEQEKADQKKKKLEYDQAVAKKKMQLAQAAINMAMAISMAAVNNWPIPAIPMMSLAAAAGAAQIAAIQSQNIPSYGSGGVIQGKSHSQGGVKAVVGGKYPVELEGQEYVIRKSSTSSNIDVLDFINKSERKLKLDDFIDFYTGGRARKNVISSSPRSKYAEGGQVIPTLRTDFDINNRLLTAFEDYSNRPTVVEVTEILNKAESIKAVQTLAGLTPSSI